VKARRDAPREPAGLVRLERCRAAPEHPGLDDPPGLGREVNAQPLTPIPQRVSVIFDQMAASTA